MSVLVAVLLTALIVWVIAFVLVLIFSGDLLEAVLGATGGTVALGVCAGGILLLGKVWEAVFA